MKLGTLNYLSFTASPASYRPRALKSRSVGWDARGGEPSTPAPGLGRGSARHPAVGGTGASSGCPLPAQSGASAALCHPRQHFAPRVKTRSNRDLGELRGQSSLCATKCGQKEKKKPPNQTNPQLKHQIQWR